MTLKSFIITILAGLLLMILVLRTLIYVYRIGRELTTIRPPHAPHIVACIPQNITTTEDQLIYNYRTLGLTCEK